jgi:hypothetical protein
LAFYKKAQHVLKSARNDLSFCPSLEKMVTTGSAFDRKGNPTLARGFSTVNNHSVSGAQTPIGQSRSWFRDAKIDDFGLPSADAANCAAECVDSARALFR